MFGVFTNRSSHRNNRSGSNPTGRANSSSPSSAPSFGRNPNTPSNPTPITNSSDDEIEMATPNNIYGRLNGGSDGSNSIFGAIQRANNPNVNIPPNNNNNENNNIPQLSPTGNRLVEFLAANNTTVTNEQQEQARRQQILRIALMICLIFFLLENRTTNPGTNAGNNHHKTIDEYPEIVITHKSDFIAMENTLFPLRSPTFNTNDANKYNLTGYYTGVWKTSDEASSSSSSFLSPFFLSPDNHHPTTASTKNETVQPHNNIDFGHIFLQINTIPIHNLPDIAFVYGPVKHYQHNGKLYNDLTYPAQGILIPALHKVILLPTRYKSEQLLVEITTITGGIGSSNSTTAQENKQLPEEGIISLPGLTFSDNKHNVTIRFYVRDLLTFPLLPAPLATNNSPSITVTTAPTKATTLAPSKQQQQVQSSMIRYTKQGKDGVWHVSEENKKKGEEEEEDEEESGAREERVILVLGEHMLPSRLKGLQLPRKLSVDGKEGNHTTAPSNSNSIDKHCDYFLEINLQDTTTTTTTATSATNTATVTNTPTTNAIFNIPPPQAINGQSLSIQNDCRSQSYSFSLTSYESQFNQLQVKVGIYSIIYILVSAFQIVLVIYQLRIVNTAAAMAKQSMLSILSQSMLDAIVCMGHLLLATAIPQMFFTTFIWIAFLKLFLFSLCHMRMVIAIYQSRNAQELSLVGWRGFRNRILSLHLRFYGVLLLILMLAFSFQTKPIIAVICLYSFWWPQIIYSFYTNTKHSFTSFYLYGMTITRLFLPLYFLGCPKNYLTILWQEFSPVMTSLSPDDPATAAANWLWSVEMSWFVIGWMGIQIAIMLIQSNGSGGPRICIPKSWFPRGYDYHRGIPRTVLLGQHTSSAVNARRSNSNHQSARPWYRRIWKAFQRGIRYVTGSTGVSYHQGIRYSSVSTDANNSNTIPANNSGMTNNPLFSWFGGAGSTDSDSDDDDTTIAAAAERSDDVVRQDELGDIETGAILPMSVHDNVNSTSSSSHGLECVICYNAIHLNVQNPYMITPCDHVFHEECLSQWMHVKLECPVCRAVLPPNTDDSTDQ